MDNQRELPKCPLLDVEAETEQVPQHIKRTFENADRQATGAYEEEYSKSARKHQTPAEQDKQLKTTSSEKQSIPPPNLQQCIQNVLGEEYRMDLLAEFSSEYNFHEKPRKLEACLNCPFCLATIDKQLLEHPQQKIVYLRSKILNETYCSHLRCFQEFQEGRSKHKLVLLGEVSPVQYVLADDDDEQEQNTYEERVGHFKEAFIEVGFYHPVSNAPIFETIRKVVFQEVQQNSGVGRFRFCDGFLGGAQYISLPYDTYRMSYRITILDVDELQNKYVTNSIVSCKKVRVLPVKQSFKLKIVHFREIQNGKKASFRISAQMASSSEAPGWVAPCGCLIALVEAEVTLNALFSEKKKKEIYVAANHSTHSETGARNKRKKEDYLDLSPQVRSTNKSVNDYPLQTQPRQHEKKQDEISKSDISFRQYQPAAQEKSRSDNSRLSYISKELNMEQVQQAIKSQNLHSYLRTQSGSRGLQKYINKCGQQDIEIIIRTIEPYLSSLFCDGYANFFCKTLCEVCTAKQRVALITKLQRNIDEIARDKRGTHSVQTLVSMMGTQGEEHAVYQMLERHFAGLSRDEQGCHVIKKMLSRFTIEGLVMRFIEKITESLQDLMTNQNGIIVIKELITRVKAFPEKRHQILSFIESHFDELIQNAFGNYAIQHVIENYPLKECDKVLTRILARIAVYSNQKISSNVVEKCIMNTNEVTYQLSQEIKNRFIVMLSRDEVIVELMKNKFGNFVLEKALKTSSKSEHKMLMKAMSKNLDSVTSSGLRQKWQDYLYDYES